MKKVAIGLALLFILAMPSVALAQEGGETGNTHFALGYYLNSFHHDFGFGLNLTSPYFLNDRVAVRFSVDTAYFESIPAGKTEYEWVPYTIYRLGLVGVGSAINDLIRLYGEGGIMYVVPNPCFSEKNKLGGYGYFGFEFLMEENHPLSYFIQLGSVGSGAKAEKVEGKPFYVDGFATTVGLRYYF